MYELLLLPASLQDVRDNSLLNEPAQWDAGRRRLRFSSYLDLWVSSVRSPFSTPGRGLQHIPTIFNPFQVLKGFLIGSRINEYSVIKMKTLISPASVHHYL